MVGLVKRCLKKVIGHARLMFDEILTVIVEVEGMLNSRPLTYLSSDDFDEPLTPAHLLTGRRLHGLPIHSNGKPPIHLYGKFLTILASRC